MKRVSTMDINELNGEDCTFYATCPWFPKKITGKVVRVDNKKPEGRLYVKTDTGKVYTVGTNTQDLTVEIKNGPK